MNISNRNRKVAFSRWNKIHNRQKELILDNLEIKKMKSMLCGFLAGDGSVQIRREKSFFHYQLDFFPDDKLMLDTYCDAIKKVYNKMPKITIKNNVFNVRLTSKIIVNDLCQHAVFGLYNWNFPEDLFMIKSTKEEWLRAFFSAEAYVAPNHIKLQTVNIKSMKKLSKLLNEFGISNNYYEYLPKKSNYSKVGIIMITRKESRKLFYKKIGFYHSKKTKSLKNSLGL